MKKEYTKDKILKAAIDEFIKYGYYGARMQRIASNAGVNKALIHYYFKNKETIYKEVVYSVGNILLNKLNKIDYEEKSVEQKISDIIDTYIEVLDKYHDYVKIILYEVIRSGDVIKNFLLENKDKIPINPIKGEIYKFFKGKVKNKEIKNVDILNLFMSIVTQIAPIFFAKNFLEEVGPQLGIKKFLIKKIIKNRKQFVIDLIMNGIRRKK